MSEPSPNSSAFWMPAVALRDRGRHGGRKVRPDSVLKNLSRPAQELIVEWSHQPPQKDADGETVPDTGGIAYALLQLREHARLAARPELAVAQSTLYAFLQWFALEQDLEISFEREQQVLAKTGNAQLARTAGETLLMRLGLAAQSPKLIQTAAQIADSRRSLDLEEKSGKTKAAQKERSLDQKDRDHAFAVEKLVIASCEKIMKAARDPKIREIVESAIPQAEKIAAIRKAYFADVDATKVDLPE
jgi:hypothetical protein